MSTYLLSFYPWCIEWPLSPSGLLAFRSFLHHVVRRCSSDVRKVSIEGRIQMVYLGRDQKRVYAVRTSTSNVHGASSLGGLWRDTAGFATIEAMVRNVAGYREGGGNERF